MNKSERKSVCGCSTVSSAASRATAARQHRRASANTASHVPEEEQREGDGATRRPSRGRSVPEQPLVHRGDRGHHRRILDRLNRAGLVEQPVSSALGERGAEHVVHPGVVAQVERAAEARQPERTRRCQQEAATARSVPGPQRKHAGRSRGSCARVIDIAEMKSEEKTVLLPRMTRVAPNEAHSGWGSGSRPERIHSPTIATRIATPDSAMPAPSSRPLSSLNRR